MKNLLKSIAGKLGYTIQRTDMHFSPVADIREPEFHEIYNFCKPFTMTTIEPMYALYQAVDYLVKSGIEGAFAECGVWRGGSSMLVARTLAARQITNRDLYLYDTFEGMPEPTSADRDLTGKDAALLMKESEHDKETSVWCFAGFDDVKSNMLTTGYPENKIHFIKGKVEDTLPEKLPGEKLALLRLDTDWYESTRHELIHLFPLLQKGGVLIIDDYGHWEGCRKAVDEYFNDNKIPILLCRIDYTVRMGIKI